MREVRVLSEARTPREIQAFIAVGTGREQERSGKPYVANGGSAWSCPRRQPRKVANFDLCRPANASSSASKGKAKLDDASPIRTSAIASPQVAGPHVFRPGAKR